MLSNVLASAAPPNEPATFERLGSRWSQKQDFDLKVEKKKSQGDLRDGDSSRAARAADAPPRTLGPDWRLGKFVAAAASLLSKLLKMSDQ